MKICAWMAPLKQREQTSRLTEFWLTASSGRSSSSSSACRRRKGIGQGHVTRTRNIGYILGLAGGGWLASQSPCPLKGGAALEGVDYFNLWDESRTGEDKWLLRATQTKWQHGLTGWVKGVKCLSHDMIGSQLKVRVWYPNNKMVNLRCWFTRIKKGNIFTCYHTHEHTFMSSFSDFCLGTARSQMVKNLGKAEIFTWLKIKTVIRLAKRHKLHRCSHLHLPLHIVLRHTDTL